MFDKTYQRHDRARRRFPRQGHVLPVIVAVFVLASALAPHASADGRIEAEAGGPLVDISTVDVNPDVFRAWDLPADLEIRVETVTPAGCMVWEDLGSGETVSLSSDSAGLEWFGTYLVPRGLSDGVHDFRVSVVDCSTGRAAGTSEEGSYAVATPETPAAFPGVSRKPPQAGPPNDSSFQIQGDTAVGCTISADGKTLTMSGERHGFWDLPPSDGNSPGPFGTHSYDSNVSWLVGKDGHLAALQEAEAGGSSWSNGFAWAAGKVRVGRFFAHKSASGPTPTLHFNVDVSWKLRGKNHLLAGPSTAPFAAGSSSASVTYDLVSYIEDDGTRSRQRTLVPSTTDDVQYSSSGAALPGPEADIPVSKSGTTRFNNVAIPGEDWHLFLLDSNLRSEVHYDGSTGANAEGDFYDAGNEWWLENTKMSFTHLDDWHWTGCTGS